MALLNTHPDYMSFADNRPKKDEYPIEYYKEFLKYVKSAYESEYWHALPREVARFQAKSLGGKSLKQASSKAQKKIWIDLDNSPHVPFFSPIINQLENRGYRTLITARDCAQTCGLADLYNLKYKRIGRHYGKNKLLKVVGLLIRAYQMLPAMLQEKPDLAISHGSRSQMFLAWVMRIPFVVIADYEYVQWLPFVKPTWMFVPELMPSSSIKLSPDCIFRYPGIKEDVYVPDFEPNPKIVEELGLNKHAITVTIRPPATEAHYHNPESEKLFVEVVNFLGDNPEAQMVILPRNEIKQTRWIKSNWAEWCATGKIIFPDHVVDGLNIIWFSDFVVSGGGTMNREAAALGVPVYSIFRGKIGAVDHYLSDTGRLTLLTDYNDIKNKLHIARREKSHFPAKEDRPALRTIVGHVRDIIETL